MRLQPRSAGFIYNRELDESKPLGGILEARGLNKQICEELARGPQNLTPDNKPLPERRKHSIKKAFNSRSKRKSLKENNKMPVATHRTSDGREYGQILSEQIYDSGGNASTYQVNRRRRSRTPSTSGIQQKHPTASFDFVRHVSSAIHHANGTGHRVSEHSAHSSLAEYRLSPHQTAEIEIPTPTSEILMDRLSEGYTAAGQKEEIPESLLRESTTDDSLGLLRDFSQILSQNEAADLSAGVLQVPVPEAEHQPRVRDFAAGGSMPLSHARAAIHCRSRSPVKKTIEKTEAPLAPERSFDANICRGQLASRLGRNFNSIILPPKAFKDTPGRLPLKPPLSMTQEQVQVSKTSPVNYHSKGPSVVSAESTAEDVQSDASSGVVFDAQSAVFIKVPPQPGPAPLTPLPSLPEGLDNFAPMTSKASQSSQNSASPESSPSKGPPQKSPARSQYKLYPSVDSSPSQTSDSPIRRNAATEGVTWLSPPLRSKRRGCSFSRSDCFPTSMNASTMDEPGQWKKERVDETRHKKLRDLGRMRSQSESIAEVKPVARDTANGKINNEGVAALSSPMDSYNAETFPVKHRPQITHGSNLSASTTLQYRGSGMLSQELSPIIVVAEQEPTSRSHQAPPPNSHFSKTNTEEQAQDFKFNGFDPALPNLTAATLQGPGDKSKARPVSSHSLPITRPLASQTTIRHLSPTLGRPYHLSGFEARLSAMERKNAMLERAFLAVLHTSAASGNGLGLKRMDDARGDLSDDLSDIYGDRTGYIW